MTNLASPRTDAERTVHDTVQADGIHVIVFWAAWCGNSISQLKRGLADAIRQHDDVTFTFVSMWDEGQTGEATLREHGIPTRAQIVGQPGVGEEAPKEDREMTFLGLPVTWIPTTWVFNRNGELATAFNYGEVTKHQLDRAIRGAKNSW
ncbi:MAG: thioredoxin [Bacteroidota bacterium]